jgi:hypothetical protein
MRNVVISSALLILAPVCPAHSEGDENGRRSLVGLREIAVVVESLNEDVIRDGLSAQDIRTYVELRLRQSGIIVVPPESEATLPGGQYLYINVNAQKRADVLLFYAVNVQVSLHQNAILLRDPAIKVFGASTWSRQVIFSGGPSFLREGVRGGLRDLLDQFLNDYLTANPKR